MNEPAGSDREARLVITRHLTAARRHILTTLRDTGPSSPDEIAARWPEHLDRNRALAARLPEIVGQLAWKLEQLGWITPVDGRFAITAAGRAVLTTHTPIKPSGERTMTDPTPERANDDWVDGCCPTFLRQPLTPDGLGELSTRLAALAHPVRLSLLSALSSSPGMTTSELTHRLDRSQATVSHHTTLLSNLGLIVVERRRSACWNVDHDQLALLRRALRS